MLFERGKLTVIRGKKKDKNKNKNQTLWNNRNIDKTERVWFFELKLPGLINGKYDKKQKNDNNKTILFFHQSQW